MTEKSIKCTWCGSSDYHKKGTRKTRLGINQVYHCKNCNSNFTDGQYLIPESPVENKAIARLSYSQNWPMYNKAQSSEKLLFLQLLGELAFMAADYQKNSVGRPKSDLSEMAFACCLKIYSGLSGRRLTSELEMARQQGYLLKTPHFNTVLGSLNNEELTPVLQELVKLSSLPLKDLEEYFAIDSTGFSTSMFSRWFDYRYGKNRDIRVWIKAHAMVGTLTNAITSIEVTDGIKADSPHFIPLLNKTCENGFHVREVSADKGYVAKSNLLAAHELGITAFIPFKKNSRGRSKGTSIWGKMYAYFQLHREEFLEHYHKRSNAETTFSMIKRKFGNNVRSKTFLGQKNEILCKVICHNLCCLIQECFERNVKLPLNEADLIISGIKEKP